MSTSAPMRVATRRYELALRTPLRTAHGEIARRSGLLVSVSDGERIGWGEAAPVPGWSAHDLDTVCEALGAAVGGRVDAAGLEAALERLESVPEARAALAGAVGDLRARQAGLPLAVWLARQAAEERPLSAEEPIPEPQALSAERPAAGTGRSGSVSVAVSEVIAAADPEAAGEAARQAVQAGIGSLKVKVATASHNTDLARVAAVRASAGPDTELRLDANGGWSPERAVQMLDSFTEFGIAFCEEPTAGIEAIAAVGAAASIPVAVDESARSLGDIATAVRSGSIGVVVVKPQALGGADLALAAIRLTRSHGAAAVVSTMIDSAVGVAHAVHTAAAAEIAATEPEAAAGPSLAHGLATSALLASDTADPLPVIGGRIAVGPGSGLGTAPG